MALPHTDFKRKYKFIDRRNLHFLINSFAQIGWTDPFAHEVDKKPVSPRFKALPADPSNLAKIPRVVTELAYA